MYKKYLIIASKLDEAGMNIANQLSQFRENPLLTSMKENSPSFDFYLVDKEIIYTENLDLEKINRYDFVIFVSKHKSSKNEKTLSIHAPGNFRSAQLGGSDQKLSMTSALFQKQFFEKLNKNVLEHRLNEKYKLTLECTHHGPLIDKPCLFVEIGSTEIEYKDRIAGFVLAKTISEIIREYSPSPYNEIAVGIGGPHYCPNFNKIQLNSNFALSHIIPNYVFPLTEEMVKEAISKTSEEVDLVILDWKGIPNSQEKERIIQILDKLYLRYEKTSKIKK